jgi:outer membrane protein assembly factor BamB
LFGLAVCQGAAAATTELVASAESHSIERFDLNGKWIGTFASTGPWVPRDLAVDGTGNVYVATSSGDILRFNQNGKPYEPMNFKIPISTNTIESLIFDKAGNLYAPTHFGNFALSGYTVSIYKFTPPQLAAATPVGTILVNTTLVRANQMAFDKGGNLCVADFTGTVECYNSNSGATVLPPVGGAQPLGIGFDLHDRLIASSTFVDTVLREPAAHTGP